MQKCATCADARQKCIPRFTDILRPLMPLPLLLESGKVRHTFFPESSRPALRPIVSANSMYLAAPCDSREQPDTCYCTRHTRHCTGWKTITVEKPEVWKISWCTNGRIDAQSDSLLKDRYTDTHLHGPLIKPPWKNTVEEYLAYSASSRMPPEQEDRGLKPQTDVFIAFLVRPKHGSRVFS